MEGMSTASYGSTAFGRETKCAGFLWPNMERGEEMDQLTDREKAAFILGMTHAFESTRWPKHFNADDRAGWRQRMKWAKHILTGGAFNPFHVWEVRELANEELGLPYVTD